MFALNKERIFLIPSRFYQRAIKLFLLSENEDNIITVVYNLIKYYHIKVTFPSIKEYIKSHPDYPSLVSVCDFFNEIKVTNYAVRLDEKELYMLNRPFIAHINQSGGKLILIYSINKEYLIYFDVHGGKNIINTQEFLKKWEGVVIIIEPTEFAGEDDYIQKRNNELLSNAVLPFSIFIFLLTTFYDFFSLFPSSYNLIPIIIYFTHSVGLFFSFLLLCHELNLKSKFTEKLCHLSAKTSCDAVTHSNVSKIFNDITWADVGITWFIGGLILLSHFKNSIILLAVLSAFSLPYAFFSVIYQWRKIKKWCPLCLSVQTILVTEFIILFNKIDLNKSVLPILFPSIIIFCVVFIIELILKMFFIAQREKEHLIISIKKIKRNPDFLNDRLKSGEQITISATNNCLTFGNYNSSFQITIFLSFYCSTCAKKFPEIVAFIHNNINTKIQIFFYPTKDDNALKLFGMISHSIKTGEMAGATDKLEKWYNADIESKATLIQSFTDQITHSELEEIISTSISIFSIAKIKSVPSVFINGYPLPSIYSLSDIKYHINYTENLK